MIKLGELLGVFAHRGCITGLYPCTDIHDIDDNSIGLTINEVLLRYSADSTVLDICPHVVHNKYRGLILRIGVEKEVLQENRFFCILGKSGSGKSSVYRGLLGKGINLTRVLLHTTRPKYDGERDGEYYYFDSEDKFRYLESLGKVHIKRVFNNWNYYFVSDDIFITGQDCILPDISPSCYAGLRSIFGKSVVPIYVYVKDDGTRLSRILAREGGKSCPNYREVCRRYISDEDDFSDEILRELGITNMFENDDLSRCVESVHSYISSMIGGISSENKLPTQHK